MSYLLKVNANLSEVLVIIMSMFKQLWAKKQSNLNQDESAASFCHQVVAWFLDMFCNFYFAKNHKIADGATTTEAREKISTDLESLSFWLKN
jgi:hypothetical protein